MIVSNNSTNKGLNFLLCDKELIKEVSITQEQKFAKKLNAMLISDELILKGIVFAGGKSWKQQRQLVSNLFHFQKIKNRIPIMLKHTNKLVNDLIPNTYPKYLQSNDQHGLSKLLQITTGNIVIGSFLGSSFDKRDVQINNQPLTIEIQNIIEQPALYGFTNKFSFIRSMIFGTHNTKIIPSFLFDKKEKSFFQRAQNLKNLVYTEIESRREINKNKTQQEILDGDNTDFLDICVKSEFQDDNELIFHLFTNIFFAGMDTTAHLTQIVLYFLAKYPQEQQLIREEAKSIFHSEQQFCDIENYNNLKNMTNFIYETLRVKSPLPNVISRIAKEDVQIGEYFIPKGSRLNFNMMGNNYNLKYQDEPYKFDMNRPENQKNLQNLNFTPFNLGARNCIGQHMAMVETKILISKILLKFKIVLNNDVDLQWQHVFLYAPKYANLVKFQLLN